MQDQIDRIESKIDKILDAQSAHNGRLVSLETQAGYFKAVVAFISSAAIAAFHWLADKLHT
jgi:hypothetical protein